METIRSYIENLFRNYPNTPNVSKAKEDLLGIMEDKYYELKAEGKSENEAIGIVISEFGSMDEIAPELGMDEKVAAEGTGINDAAEVKRITLAQAEGFLKAQEAFGARIGIGVAFCILSPAISVVSEAMMDVGLLPEPLAEIMGGVGLFLMVAVGVAIFIISGMVNGKYEEYKKKRILLDEGAKRALTERQEGFQRGHGIKIAIGVVLCILSVVPTFVIGEVFVGDSVEWIADLSGISLFVLVSIGVYLFISTGTKQGAYEVLLGKNQAVCNSALEKKKKKRISIVASIYWPIVTAGYIAWSFFTMKWGFTWIIWPIAGILFSGISGVITLASAEE